MEDTFLNTDLHVVERTFVFLLILVVFHRTVVSPLTSTFYFNPMTTHLPRSMQFDVSHLVIIKTRGFLWAESESCNYLTDSRRWRIAGMAAAMISKTNSSLALLGDLIRKHRAPQKISNERDHVAWMVLSNICSPAWLLCVLYICCFGLGICPWQLVTIWGRTLAACPWHWGISVRQTAILYLFFYRLAAGM